MNMIQDCAQNNQVYYSPYDITSTSSNKTIMLDFNTDLYSVKCKDFMGITEKLYESINRNQTLGNKYVTPMLLKLTNYLDNVGSLQDIPSDINECHNYLLSIVSDWKTMLHDNDQDKDLSFSDNRISYKISKRKQNIHLSKKD